MEAKQGFFEKLKRKIQEKISPEKKSKIKNPELQKLYQESVKNAPERIKEIIKALQKPSNSKSQLIFLYHLIF